MNIQLFDRLAFGTHFIRGQRTDIRYNNRIPALRFQRNSRVLGPNSDDFCYGADFLSDFLNEFRSA